LINTFIRSFSATKLIDDNGNHIGGIVGFLRSVGAAIRDLKVTRCIVVFDGKGGSQRRRKTFSEYKNNRKSTFTPNRSIYKDEDEERAAMKRQLAMTTEYLFNLPLTIIYVDKIEADDSMAYIANNLLYEEAEKIYIMSTDLDFYQLIDDKIKIWSPTKKIIVDKEYVKEEFNVPVHNFLMLKLFLGDTSDNIPGVKGVGVKNAVKNISILQNENAITIEDVLAYCEERKSDAKIFTKILESKDVLYLANDLAQLGTPNMSANARMKIQDQLKIVNKYNFKQIQADYVKDKLYSYITNLNYWLSTTYGKLIT